MFEPFDFWKLLAGLGLFLFAMLQIETALRAIGGRTFKQALRNYTDRPLKGVITGTLITATVQSSSVVGLMVLAFVGAGLMSLQNALGIIFGANLGTTFTGWIVATLGFKLDIQALSLPLIAIGTLALLSAGGRMAEFGRLLAGLGFLLLGLDFMKASVASVQEMVEPAAMAGFSAWQYLLFGVAFAAIIQSSSATMMIALAALDAGLITLPSAAAVAIGADLGTTTTVLLGALKGTGPKKRVALAHFLFNVVTDIIAFAMRTPLLAVVAFLGIEDPLLALVAFHSLFNLVGIALFLPFTGILAARLSSLFLAAPERAARHVPEVTPAVTEAALAAIDEETAHLLTNVIYQNRCVFTPPLPLPPGRLPVISTHKPHSDRGDFDQMYSWTKRLEGEILAFTTRLQSEPLETEESRRLTQLLSAVRYAVHSSKQLKDIHQDLVEFSESEHGAKATYLQHVQSVMTAFYGELYQLRSEGEPTLLFEDLVTLFQHAHEWHDQLHQDIFDDIRSQRVADADISTLLNVNRELLNSNLALLMALSYYQLTAEQAESIARLPGVG